MYIANISWKLVTLQTHSLLVNCRVLIPMQIHDYEVEYWDKTKEKELPNIHIQPVLYQNYESVVAHKG